MNKIHELKLDVEFFDSVNEGIKNFEIRFNDRDYKVYDFLVLKEFDSASGKYTGRKCIRKVTYISNYEQKDGYVVMSLSDEDQIKLYKRYYVSFGEDEWGMIVACDTESQAEEISEAFQAYYDVLDYLEIMKDGKLLKTIIGE